jgi:hypothetical protein
MKLNAKHWFVMAMMAGSLAVGGCARSSDAADPVAPEETVAGAPVQADANAVEKDERPVHFWAKIAPPPIRFEERGRAPSERHFWAPGYWHWNGREHLWFGGRWELRRDGFEFIGPHWREHHGRWEYIPGYWVRRG